MNMLEFVTVKDSILEFLKSQQEEVIDSSLIYNDLKFICQPNGVVDACIEEMEVDKVITVGKVNAKDMVSIADSGIRLLAEGGYSKRLIVEKKIVVNNFNPVPNPENKKALRPKRKREMTVIASSLTVISVLSSIIFKRI